MEPRDRRDASGRKPKTASGSTTQHRKRSVCPRDSRRFPRLPSFRLRDISGRLILIGCGTTSTDTTRIIRQLRSWSLGTLSHINRLRTTRAKFDSIPPGSLRGVQGCICVPQKLLKHGCPATLEAGNSKTRRGLKSHRGMFEFFSRKFFAQAIDGCLYARLLAIRDDRDKLFSAKAAANIG